jgi:hypothetical protein
MPDMQPSMPSAASQPGQDASLPAKCDEFDDALGCECAYPALQIERWAQEARLAEAN